MQIFFENNTNANTQILYIAQDFGLAYDLYKTNEH